MAHVSTSAHFFLQYRPTSLQMFELMCWCWSEKPHHRPNFPEILQVLRTDTFTRLLVATPTSKDEKDITAACLRTTMAPVRRRSTTTSNFHCRTNMMSLVNDVSLPYFNTVSPLSCSSLTEEMCVEVWYGMEDGSLGVVQYQHSGTLIEVIHELCMWQSWVENKRYSFAFFLLCHCTQSTVSESLNFC